jgi:tRNA (guanine-N7-)-methyltransferase
MARILKDYPSISLKSDELNGKVGFAQIFGRTAAVHIEVGTGRATFLLNEAKACPQINFLGIEWASRYYRYAVDRIGRWSLNNVRIIRADAADFLTRFVPDNSINCFHIYFPDPWPKKRHHKRRLFSSANTQQMLRCLKAEGVIKTVTDHAEYFQQIQKVLLEQCGQFEEIEFAVPAGAERGEWVGTNFERKYLKEQRPVFCLAVRKL